MTLAVAVVMALAVAQAGDLREYVDPAGRFRFFYPAEFGEPSRGTNDGFGDRVAAIRFGGWSSGLGGEAALTRGSPVVDIQAAGGLYDEITLEIFPNPIRRIVVRALAPLGVTNVCQQISQEQHLDPGSPALAGLTGQQRAAIAAVDRMRNVDPRVLRCVVDGSTVTFDKDTASQPAGPRQHVYGAIRFLDAPYATFQSCARGRRPMRTCSTR